MLLAFTPDGDKLYTSNVGKVHVREVESGKVVSSFIHQGERIVPAAQNTGGNGQPIHITVNVNGNSSAPDVRRSAGQGAREAMGALMVARRYV